ncbi:hypothetical protein [Desertibacillus haloalkaliphilus]|uniref:hypothetical protein n=1 Tax=Desertibacillus haloalkaliphilus TaxID=1328930 RepID=UPI001C25D844|nr:hypothetical protein [Desertibacillus haloalkaliphilus]MBU8908189.1 hypothetical protein [Desertibacillus haloalkaliphilus]
MVHKNKKVKKTMLILIILVSILIPMDNGHFAQAETIYFEGEDINITEVIKDSIYWTFEEDYDLGYKVSGNATMENTWRWGFPNTRCRFYKGIKFVDSADTHFQYVDPVCTEDLKIGENYFTRIGNRFVVAKIDSVTRTDIDRWEVSYYNRTFDLDEETFVNGIRFKQINWNPIVDVSTPANNTGLSEVNGYNQFDITGSVSDEDDGDEVTVKYSIDGVSNHQEQSLFSYVSNGSSISFSESITIDSNFPEGNHTLKVWAEDHHGGISNVRERNFFVDKSPPSINISISDGEVYEEYPTVIFSASDTGGSGLETGYPKATLNGQTIASGTEVDVDGDHTLEVTAKDKVGNEQVKTVEFQINTSSIAKIINSVDWDMNKDGRYAVVIADNEKKDFTPGDDNYNALIKELDYNNVTFFGLGTPNNEAQIEEFITSTNNDGSFIDNSNIDTALNQLADMIIDQMIKSQDFGEITLLLEEEFSVSTEYEDNEGDPKFDERFRFEHDQNYYENPTGPHEQRDTWMDSMLPYFNEVGKYTLNYQAKDDPAPGMDSASGFDQYRKWSNIADNAVVYAHRPPVADFEPYLIEQDDGSYELMIIDNSYDLDAYSQGQRGIMEKNWRYREVGGNWESTGQAQPTLDDLSENGEYEIELMVEDFQGAFDTHREKLKIVTELPNLPPTAGFIHKSPHVVGESVPLTSLAYDPNGDTLEINYEIITPSGEVVSIPRGYHDPIDEIDGDYIYYQPGSTQNFVRNFIADEVGFYEITQYVSDGQESDVSTSIVEIIDLTILGYVNHTERWSEIHAERECADGPCPEYEFYSGEKFIFKAEIDDYPVYEDGGIEQVLVRFTGERKDGNTISIGHNISDTGDNQRDPIPLTRVGSSNTFVGEFYEEWMTDPMRRFKTGSTVDFQFEVTYEEVQEDGHINEQVRFDDDQILIIGSIYEAFDYHRKY